MCKGISSGSKTVRRRMANLTILTYPNPILKEKCLPVTEVTDEIRTLLNDMVETMYQNAGIGLAAIQVGKLIRAIVIDIGQDEHGNEGSKVFKIINPEIIEEEGKIKYEEGCLSVPGVREDVIRAERIKLKALDENGTPIEINATGLLAICIQHELDHLNGILFVDRLSRIRKELIKGKLKKLSVR